MKSSSWRVPWRHDVTSWCVPWRHDGILWRHHGIQFHIAGTIRPNYIFLGVCSQVLLFGRHTGCSRRCEGGSERARVRCAWAKFKELSFILIARGASYRIKGKIYKISVQIARIYGTETWEMKEANLRVWRERNGWWWDGCAGGRRRIGIATLICTVFWVFRAWLRWWGRADWGGLGMCSARVRMIGCRKCCGGGGERCR